MPPHPRQPPIATQLEAIERAGFSIAPANVFEDHDPATIQLGERPVVRKLLDAVEPGDKVVVAAAYLLGITRADVRAMIRQLHAAGARVATLDPDEELNSHRHTGTF